MRNKLEPARSSTEPTIQKIYQKTIKTRGVIYINIDPNKNKRSPVIELKQGNKLLFHCYQKYKTFSYSFDLVKQIDDLTPFYSWPFMKTNSIQSIQNGLNYLQICVGNTVQGQKSMPLSSNLFFDQLASVYHNLIKTKRFEWKLSYLIITDQSINDLSSNLRAIEIRQLQNSKNGKKADVSVESQFSSPESEYQIIEELKQALSKRSKYSDKSYFTIYAQLTNLISKEKDRPKLLLVDCTKVRNMPDKGWDSKNVLVLHKCILGLIDKMDNAKQSYSPFRDSKFTRLLKPFLTADSKNDVVGVIDQNDELTMASTLNLVKNLSKVRVPVLQMLKEEYKMTYNPQNSLQKIDKREERQQFYTLDSSNVSKRDKMSKKDLINDVRQNRMKQSQYERKASKIKFKLRMIEKRKQFGAKRLNLGTGSDVEDQLEEEEVLILRKKQEQALEQCQRIKNSISQSIEKSVSTVQKLKILKEYYTVSLSNQKEEMVEFVKNQQAFKKLYLQKIKMIDKNLKKNPRQLIGKTEPASPPQIKNPSSYISSRKNIEVLPSLNLKQKKRAIYIKQKVKKGRVEYQDFLSKNISQYQSYSLNKQ